MTLIQFTLKLVTQSSLSPDLSLLLYHRGWVTDIKQQRIQLFSKQFFYLTELLFTIGISLEFYQASAVAHILLTLTLCNVLLMLGFFKQRESMRLININQALAAVLEGLMLCNGAGLSIPQSIERLSQFLDKHNVLKREWLMACHQLQSGLNLNHVLDALYQRNPTRNLERLILLLKSQYRYGHELEQGLLDEIKIHQQDELQAIRSTHATLNLKLLMPMLGCFLPSIIMMILIPSLTDLVHFFN